MSQSQPQPELEGVTVVVLGSFNPSIFQPRSLAEWKLLPEDEANEATLEVVHREISIFSTDWFSAQITTERFAIDTSDMGKVDPLRDLVLGIFQILEHTPTTAFGFNRNQHFRMESEEKWHAFGHRMAPKEPWANVLESPGLLTLRMVGKRPGSEAKTTQVRIEPSAKVKPGIYISVNEHYELSSDDAEPQSMRNRKFLTTLKNGWDGFLEYSRTVFKGLATDESPEG